MCIRPTANLPNLRVNHALYVARQRRSPPPYDRRGSSNNRFAALPDDDDGANNDTDGGIAAREAANDLLRLSSLPGFGLGDCSVKWLVRGNHCLREIPELAWRSKHRRDLRVIRGVVECLEGVGDAVDEWNDAAVREEEESEEGNGNEWVMYEDGTESGDCQDWSASDPCDTPVDPVNFWGQPKDLAEHVATCPHPELIVHEHWDPHCACSYCRWDDGAPHPEFHHLALLPYTDKETGLWFNNYEMYSGESLEFLADAIAEDIAVAARNEESQRRELASLMEPLERRSWQGDDDDVPPFDLDDGAVGAAPEVFNAEKFGIVLPDCHCAELSRTDRLDLWIAGYPWCDLWSHVAKFPGDAVKDPHCHGDPCCPCQICRWDDGAREVERAYLVSTGEEIEYSVKEWEMMGGEKPVLWEMAPWDKVRELWE